MPQPKGEHLFSKTRDRDEYWLILFSYAADDLEKRNGSDYSFVRVDLSFQELDIFGKTIVRQKYTFVRDI